MFYLGSFQNKPRRKPNRTAASKSGFFLFRIGTMTSRFIDGRSTRRIIGKTMWPSKDKNNIIMRRLRLSDVNCSETDQRNGSENKESGMRCLNIACAVDGDWSIACRWMKLYVYVCVCVLKLIKITSSKFLVWDEF